MSRVWHTTASGYSAPSWALIWSRCSRLRAAQLFCDLHLQRQAPPEPFHLRDALCGLLGSFVARKHAGRLAHKVGFPATEQLGLELILAAHLGGAFLPAEDFQHYPRLELGAELTPLAHGDTLLLDLSYLICLPVQDLGSSSR